MLNKLVDAQMCARRRVLLHHPNAVACQVLRKVLKRPDPQVNGVPTLGGLGVMNADDEEAFDYVFVGNGVAMQVEGGQPSVLVDNADAALGAGAEFRFMIEPEEPDDQAVPAGFAKPGEAPDPQLKKSDVFYLVFGADPAVQVKVAYEVTGLESTAGMAPFAPRYIAIRRDDLDDYPSL